MRCIAVIPARFGSVRFPGKPLASLQGRPLVVHVAERCAAVPGIDASVVATDDERIAAAVRAAGFDARMTPVDLLSGTDRVAHVVESEQADVVVNVQGDEPLIDPVELGEALAAFIAGDAEFGTLRAPLRAARDLWDPNVVKVVIDATGRALYFSRAPVPFPRSAWLAASNRAGSPELRFEGAPELPGPYWIHVGVYLYRRTGLLRWARMPRSSLERLEGLEQLRVLEAGEALQTLPISHSVPGVDTPEDLDRVRRLLEGVDVARG